VSGVLVEGGGAGRAQSDCTVEGSEFDSRHDIKKSCLYSFKTGCWLHPQFPALWVLVLFFPWGKAARGVNLTSILL
jgi:hypothetical protein